jgi:hypothetical protein
MNKSTNEEYIEYRDSYGNNQIARQAFIESLGEQFKQRCRESDGADSVETIIDDMKIAYETFQTWLKKYPILKEGYIQGKIILAGKMRTNIIRKKFDPTNSPRFIGDLNPEYYEQFAKYEKIKQSGVQAPEVIFVKQGDNTPEEYKKKEVHINVVDK